MTKLSIPLALALPFTLLILYSFFALAAFRTQPEPYHFEGHRTVALTNARQLQLLNPFEYPSLLFRESSHNPYTYGWEKDTLYFEDRWGRNYKWSDMDNPPEKIKAVFVEDPRFLRQPKQFDNCNLAHRPNYSDAMKKSYPGGIDKIGCYFYSQGNVKVELWPLEVGDILAVQYRRVVIEYNGKTLISDEPRLISDVAISESGKYVAITASQPQEYAESFAATDIYVIELK